MLVNASSLFNTKSDEDWLEILIRSVTEPRINDIEMPRFPHRRVQEQFIGSADEHAMREGFVFYNHVKQYCEALGNPLHNRSRLLDFGCGWGRYTRFFWHDIDEDCMLGVDVDPDIIAVCKALGTPGSFERINPDGKLPYADNSIDVITAYSVFSHLPENVAHHWMAELSRVAAPGCVIAFTTEPRRFLEFVGSIPTPPDNDWHASLARFKDDMPGHMAAFDRGEFCYIPTSGGDYRDADVYGDAAVPRSYMEKNWDQYFTLREYIDNPERFWQAFVVMQKT